MNKSPETMTRNEMLKVARAWARKQGGVLKPSGTINGKASYKVVDSMGRVICDNWTLYSIACDAIYA